MLKKRERHDGTTTRCGGCGVSSASGYAFCPACGAPAAEPPLAEQVEIQQLNQLLDGSHEPPAGGPGVPQRGKGRTLRETIARHKPMVASSVLMALVLVAIAVWGYGYLRDSPVRAALDDASSSLSPVYGDLVEAQSLSDLHAAAGTLEDLTDDLASARSTATEASGEMAEAGEVLLQAQEEFAVAGSALGGLTEEDLSAWADTRTALMDAVGAIEEARSQLRTVDEGRAQEAKLPTEAITNVEEVVAQATVVSVGAQFSDLFDDLGTAEKTVEVRDVADAAGEAGTAVRAVLEGIEDETPEHERLTGFAETYAATARLSVLDASHLGDWAGVRAEMMAALNGMSDQDSGLVTAARTSVGAVDELVSEGRTSLRTWRAEYDAAKAAKEAAVAELDTYRDAMTGQLDRYSTLRASLSDWVDRVDDPANSVTYDEGYDVLWRAESDRIAVRDAMGELHVPAALSAPHNSLVATVDDAILAVSAAYQGTLDAQWCEVATCYYEDTPGWQRFSSESSRITTAFSGALEEWEGALATAQGAAGDQQLPPRPEI